MRSKSTTCAACLRWKILALKAFRVKHKGVQFLSTRLAEIPLHDASATVERYLELEGVSTASVGNHHSGAAAGRE